VVRLAPRSLFAFVALAAASLAVSGCFAGYELVHYKDALGDVRTIAVQGLANETFEPGVEAIVSDAIVGEFIRRGALDVVDDGASADLVVDGAVEDIFVQSRTFSSIQFALEYAVTIKLRLEVKRRDGTKVDLDDRILQESDLYFASADIETMRKNREEAVRRVSMIIAGRLHDSLFERSIP
jgi:hypothetical protein